MASNQWGSGKLFTKEDIKVVDCPGSLGCNDFIFLNARSGWACFYRFFFLYDSPKVIERSPLSSVPTAEIDRARCVDRFQSDWLT